MIAAPCRGQRMTVLMGFSITNGTSGTHSRVALLNCIEIVVKELGQALEHVKGYWLENTHHLQVISCNGKVIHLAMGR